MEHYTVKSELGGEKKTYQKFTNDEIYRLNLPFSICVDNALPPPPYYNHY